MSFVYKKKYKFEQRLKESTNIKKKYTNRIPIIIERNKKSELPDIDKHKYLVPNDLTLGQFVYIIRKRINLPSHMAMFLLINNTLPPTNELLINVYNQNRDADGFLYGMYDSQATFGNN